MNKLLSLVLAVALMVGASAALAADKGTPAAKPAEQGFKAMFPNFAVDSFRESPIKGLYEIAAGGNIIYFSPAGYLVFGEIFDQKGSDITANRKAELLAGKISGLPLDKAFKIGSGKVPVIEISDPDCPYCRKASEYLSKRTDITRYVFFLPLKQIHPDSEKHARYILAKNTYDAYEEAYTGKLDGRNFELMPDMDKRAAAWLREQEEIVAGLGVRGTPAFFINGKFVNGANIPEIEKILGGK